MKFRLSLTGVYLGGLIALGVALVLVSYQQQVRVARRNIRSELERRAAAIGLRTGAQLEYFLGRGDSAAAELDLAGLGGIPGLIWAVVTDEAGVIRLATDPSFVGQDAAQVVGPAWTEDAEDGRWVTGEPLHEGTSLTSLHAFRPPPKPGELRSRRAAYLALRFDMADLYAEAHATAGDRTVEGALIIVALCLFFWVGHQLLVGRPLTRLVEATARVGRGEGAVSVEPRGATELRRLTEAFNVMAAKIETRERELERSAKIHRIVSRANEAMVHATDEPTLLKELCRIVVEEGGYRMAWVGFVDPEGDQWVRPAAWASANADYLETLQVSAADLRLGQGPTGTALRTRAPVICTDIATDPLMAPWRESALARGFRSSVALPLRAGSGIQGVLSVYAGEPDGFRPSELALLVELASDVSSGLETFRAHAERAKAEAVLRATNAKLELALTTARLGYWEYDVTTDRFTFDDHFLALLGTSADEVGGRQFRSVEVARRFLHPDEASRVTEEIGAALASGDAGYARAFEQLMRRADGRPIHVLMHLSVTKAASGKTRSLHGVAQDVTDRKRMELQADEARRHAAAIIDGASDAIITVDDALRIVVFNPAAEQIFGAPAREVIGQSVERFIPKRFLEAHRRHVAGFEAGEYPTRRMDEVRAVSGLRADGTEFPMEATITKGKLEGRRLYTLTCRDISHRQQEEEERRALEAQLRQAQKMEAVGQLAGGVAHDFNNILAAIQMQVGLVLGEPGLPEHLHPELREIRLSAERAANLTRQLLLFSRKQRLQVKAVDLNDVVTSLARMLQRVLREDVRLELRPHPAPLPLEADPGMLDQVLLNLAVNSRDAMPAGGQLVITTGQREVDPALAARHPSLRPGTHAFLRVTDTGDGIPPDLLPRIFDPFFTTKPVGQGTGLGLATVFGIVAQHRGAIEVQSAVGRGTTFEILLPLTTAPMGADTEALAPHRGRRVTETVLVVEDEPAVRRLTQRVLEREGYTVIAAASGPEALRCWENRPGPIALLLTDIVMPEGMTGQEVARVLRERDPGLRVIFTSGYAIDPAGRPIEIATGEAFLQKPVSPQQLLAAVARILDG
jgi:PAS domain S-box-containing protein